MRRGCVTALVQIQAKDDASLAIHKIIARGGGVQKNMGGFVEMLEMIPDSPSGWPQDICKYNKRLTQVL